MVMAVMEVMRVVENCDHESQSVLQNARKAQCDVDTTRMGQSLLSPMRLTLRLRSRQGLVALILAAAMGAAACKQGDGAVPAKVDDVPNRLGDLKRDMEAVVRGEQPAVQDLTDDLLVFVNEPEGRDATKAMSMTVCSMLVKRSVNDDTQTRIVELMWQAVAARELSERQVDALKDDMRTTLQSVGVSQPDANLAAGRVGDVQKAVTLRTRRWYERY
jgi:hypothetical protein